MSWVLTIAAAVACAAWLERAARATPFWRLDALSIAGWAGLSAVGHLLAVARPGREGQLGWVLSIASAVLVVIGVTGATRRVVLSGRLRHAVAEAALVGVGVVTLLWGITGADRDGASALRPLTTAVVGTTLFTLALRARAVSPSLVVDGRFRAPLALGAAAAAAIALSGWLGVFDGSAARLGAAFAATVGYLAAAAAAVVGLARARPARQASLPERLLPLVVAVLAAMVLVARALSDAPGGLGASGAVLGSLLLACLLALQVLLSRENEQLSSDLEYSKAHLAAMAANSGDVIIGLDRDGRVVAANDAAGQLLCLAPEELIGSDIAGVAVPDDQLRVRSAVLDVAHGNTEAARVELILAPPATGSAELRLRGLPDGAVANLSDVTESVQLRDRLVTMTRYDQMTGLANRSHLVETLGRWLTDGHQVAALYIDLDGFKAVNDRFGHLAGDAVLTEVARRLQSAAGTVSTRMPMVARMGGDEFVLALRDASMGEAMSAGDGVLGALRPTFPVADRAVRIGASIGVGAADDGGPPGTGIAGAAALLHRADIAMFAAKQAGRGRVLPWNAPLEEQARRKVDIAIGLRHALETGRLALAYQPIVRLSDGVIIAVEALIRLPDSSNGYAEGAFNGSSTRSVEHGSVEHGSGEHGTGSLAGLADLVSPAELVEVAEGTGEIDELGRWVLTEATHQAALWQRMDHKIRVSVNMSVRQLSDPDFVGAVHAALSAAHLPPDRLVIEITEGQLVGEGDRADSTIRRLRAQGVSLAIDDFGSGYSSLSYLRRMPVRTVKIDRTLLAGVGSDPRATTLVRAVIGAARGLGLHVVCEGIENLATARLLRDLGAWGGQGFALHAAMSAKALLDVLEGPPVDLGDPIALPSSSPSSMGSSSVRSPMGPPTGPSITAPASAGQTGVSHHETASGGD